MSRFFIWYISHLHHCNNSVSTYSTPFVRCLWFCTFAEIDQGYLWFSTMYGGDSGLVFCVLW